MTRMPAMRVEARRRRDAALIAAAIAIEEDRLQLRRIAIMVLALEGALPDNFPRA